MYCLKSFQMTYLVIFALSNILELSKISVQIKNSHASLVHSVQAQPHPQGRA